MTDFFKMWQNVLRQMQLAFLWFLPKTGYAIKHLAIMVCCLAMWLITKFFHLVLWLIITCQEFVTQKLANIDSNKAFDQVPSDDTLDRNGFKSRRASEDLMSYSVPMSDTSRVKNYHEMPTQSGNDHSYGSYNSKFCTV